ncbi:hypothetical protein CFRA_08460 [Corynebacterium frankenforstense DSM 45800]|uniref:SPOR domain-containing protein n=1 Tax=Corynebacterium frankenforstense DSM 45800 TaxID=1437875 RepID=A0A1L7CTT7_9CORY|nr:hypothetical protein [Corynebacterium frankenforstense]APT89276.1 hypothetical protein CFRA_08460 [Corynebacterium frankenforstense DSM 45800]
MAAQDDKFYFDPATGEVTQGKTGSWENRMGPYDTEAEAREALKTAAERNEEFDEQDKAWEGEED